MFNQDEIDDINITEINTENDGQSEGRITKKSESFSVAIDKQLLIDDINDSQLVLLGSQNNNNFALMRMKTDDSNLLNDREMTYKSLDVLTTSFKSVSK